MRATDERSDKANNERDGEPIIIGERICDGIFKWSKCEFKDNENKDVLCNLEHLGKLIQDRKLK